MLFLPPATVSIMAFEFVTIMPYEMTSSTSLDHDRMILVVGVVTPEPPSTDSSEGVPRGLLTKKLPSEIEL